MKILINDLNVVIAKGNNITETETHHIFSNTAYQKDFGFSLLDIGNVTPDKEPIPQKHRYVDGEVIDNPDYITQVSELEQRIAELEQQLQNT